MDGWAAIAAHTRRFSPELIEGIEEISNGPLLHTRVAGERAREASQREHGGEKARGRPRIAQEEGLLRVAKASLVAVDNKGRTVLFNSNTKVLEGLTRHVRVITLQRSRERTRPACQCGNR